MEHRKMKRSEVFKKYKKNGIPRYLTISEEEKRRESIMWIILAGAFLFLVVAGKTEMQRIAGGFMMFLVNAVGVLSRWLKIGTKKAVKERQQIN